MMLLFRTARPAGALRSARALVAQRAVPVEYPASAPLLVSLRAAAGSRLRE